MLLWPHQHLQTFYRQPKPNYYKLFQLYPNVCLGPWHKNDLTMWQFLPNSIRQCLFQSQLKTQLPIPVEYHDRPKKHGHRFWSRFCSKFLPMQQCAPVMSAHRPATSIPSNDRFCRCFWVFQSVCIIRDFSQYYHLWLPYQSLANLA